MTGTPRRGNIQRDSGQHSPIAAVARARHRSACDRDPLDCDPGPLAAYADKTAAIVSISGGVFGGIRGLVPLRLLLSNLGMLVLPIQIAVGGAAEAFDEDGTLRNKGTETLARSMARSLVRYGRA